MALATLHSVGSHIRFENNHSLSSCHLEAMLDIIGAENIGGSITIDSTCQ